MPAINEKAFRALCCTAAAATNVALSNYKITLAAMKYAEAKGMDFERITIAARDSTQDAPEAVAKMADIYLSVLPIASGELAHALAGAKAKAWDAAHLTGLRVIAAALGTVPAPGSGIDLSPFY